MAPRRYSLATPGLTDVYTFKYACNTRLDETRPD